MIRKRLPLKKKVDGSAAFTLVEIMIVVLIIGILLGIALPNYVNAREQSRRKACTGNLRKIDYAKDAYMMDNNMSSTTPASAFTDAVMYGDSTRSGYLLEKPSCPGGGNYSINAGDQLPTCDYGGSTTNHTFAGT